MLRSFLIGVLSMTALASCKGKEAGPAVQAGVAAGKVVELSGTVTAKRGGESRTLTSGTEVSGDDVIETGADSSVSIVLAHNNATWSLGPNKRKKVAESLAWSLAKVDTPAGGSVEATSAAGRHAEKAGANSSATAVKPDRAMAKEEAPPGGAPPAPGAPAPTTAPVVAAQPASPGNAAPTPPAEPARSLAEPAPKADVSKAAKGGGADHARLETGTPPPPPPPPPPAPDMKDMKKEAASEIQLLATRERARLQACLPASMPSLAIVLVVTNGKALVQVPAGTPAEVKTCLADLAAKMKSTPGLTDKLSLTIKR